MYGMIHKAAKQLATAKIGAAAWAELEAKCGLSSEHFISGQHYADEITFRLIDEIAARLGTPVDNVLHDFGRYWVKFAEESAYAPVLDMGGDDLETFLANLDRMHASIKVTLPEAITPRFKLASVSPDRIAVHYSSPRKGLEPFVAGLLDGLLERFGERGKVSSAPDADVVVFTIARIRAVSAA